MELSKEWRDSLILEDGEQGDNWFIASRHLVPKQPVMFLKKLELTRAHILLTSWGLRKHQGEKNSTFCFLKITTPSPILLRHFALLRTEGLILSIPNWLFSASHPFLLKWFTGIQKRKPATSGFLLSFFPPSLQAHLDPFSFLSLPGLTILVFLSHPLLLRGPFSIGLQREAIPGLASDAKHYKILTQSQLLFGATFYEWEMQ